MTAVVPSATGEDEAVLPPYWRTHRVGLSALAVFVTTVALTVLCFPPYQMPEFAYAFAAPAVFWAFFRPSLRLFAVTMFLAQAVAWTILLGWLHHVTWLGLFLLGPFVGVWVGSWYLAVWWAIPQLPGRHPVVRILALAGLAGLWVLIEWSRTWLLSGFPWLPLAASQWHRVMLLQVAAWTGAYGISFILIFFNLGFAAYAHRLFREKHTGLRRRSPEFIVALLVLVVPSFLMFGPTFGQRRETVARIALVQPDVPQSVKWDPDQGPAIARGLQEVTMKASYSAPDLIFWPEAVTPWAVLGDATARDFVSELARAANVPLVLGSVAVEHAGEPDEAWYNGVFVVTPAGGVQKKFYAKRHLVPFGEYVPLRPLLGWISKFVPVGGDFQPGKGPQLLQVPLPSGSLVLGPLICYEDVYPELARASVNAGAEVLGVFTNDGWFGDGGELEQHAAHSVLRAVENRRPVVRVGNTGWSGWIDEYGNVRSLLQDGDGNLTFRGARVVEVTRDMRWAGRRSFYTRYGDWFVLVSGALLVLGFIALTRSQPPAPAGAEPEPPRRLLQRERGRRGGTDGAAGRSGGTGS